MAVYRLWAGTITGGGTGALDAIDPTDIDGSATALTAGSTCDVVDKTNGIKAEYQAVDSAGATEAFPDVIIPDTNPSNWWWSLVKIEYDYQEPVNSTIGYANTPGVF